MGLQERLGLSRRSLELLNALKSADVPVSERLKLSRERLDILKKLKANVAPKQEAESEPELGLESVVSKGASACQSYGYTVPKELKSELANLIANDGDVVALVGRLPYSERKKAQILDSIKLEPRDYDVYRIAGGLKHREGYDVYKRVHNIHKGYYSGIGTEALASVYSGLVEDSPLSFQESVRLAKKSSLDRNASNRISRQRKGDFKGAKGKESMFLSAASLYRLIAFQGEPINYTVRDDRADFAHKSRTISVGKGLSKKSLWHELAHSIEYDHPEVLGMTKAFLNDRLAKSNGIRSLNDIYVEKWGGKRKTNYTSDELTIDDGAFHPYVTKFYCHDGGEFSIENATATEVLSMGLECFSDPVALGRMITHDPEHFEFIVGVIKHLHSKARANQG